MFFLKYEGRVKLTPPQKKIPSKSSTLLGLKYHDLLFTSSTLQFQSTFELEWRGTSDLSSIPNKL